MTQSLNALYAQMKQMDMEMIPLLKEVSITDVRAHLSNHHLQLAIYYLALHLKNPAHDNTQQTDSLQDTL